jgi:GxxExxY protein
MSKEQTYDLAGRVIGLAMIVHRTLGPGFSESVYHNALCLELAEAGIDFESKPKLCVFYKEKPIGNFEADLIVESALIVELKAVETLVKAYEVQLVNYLATTKIDEGLLLNFGAESLQYRKKFRIFKKPLNPPPLNS